LVRFRAKKAHQKDHFVVLISLSDLKAVKGSQKIIPKLQEVCIDLQECMDPQCKTGQFYDQGMNLLAIYLGIRVVGGREDSQFQMGWYAFCIFDFVLSCLLGSNFL